MPHPSPVLPDFLHCAKIHTDLSSVPALIEIWNGLLGAPQTEIYSTACSEMALAVLSASKTEGLTAQFQSLSGLSRRKTLIQALHLNFEGNVISKFCTCLWRTLGLSRTVQLKKSTGSFSVLSPSVCSRLKLKIIILESSGASLTLCSYAFYLKEIQLSFSFNLVL